MVWRSARRILVPLGGVLLAFTIATPASAVTYDQRLGVLSSWSQPNAGSYSGWNAARQNRGGWAGYGLDWSTDLCSSSPDQPLGFDFRLPCHRHDFGYRNYKAMNAFPANKSRIDDSFYFDLQAKCAIYRAFVRPACRSLAWTYYQAVKTLGSLAVSQADLNRATRLKADGERRQALALNHPG